MKKVINVLVFIFSLVAVISTILTMFFLFTSWISIRPVNYEPIYLLPGVVMLSAIIAIFLLKVSTEMKELDEYNDKLQLFNERNSKELQDVKEQSNNYKKQLAAKILIVAELHKEKLAAKESVKEIIHVAEKLFINAMKRADGLEMVLDNIPKKHVKKAVASINDEAGYEKVTITEV